MKMFLHTLPSSANERISNEERKDGTKEGTELKQKGEQEDRKEKEGGRWGCWGWEREREIEREKGMLSLMK